MVNIAWTTYLVKNNYFPKQEGKISDKDGTDLHFYKSL